MPLTLAVRPAAGGSPQLDCGLIAATPASRFWRQTLDTDSSARYKTHHSPLRRYTRRDPINN
jgi:hypothetical protein